MVLTSVRKEEYSQGISQLGDTIRINAGVFQKIKPHQLPQTKDELTRHIRANYKANASERSLEINLDIPSNVGHGCEKKDDQLYVVWMENHQVLELVLELVA